VEHRKPTTKAGGIDVSKLKLDVAAVGVEEVLTVANDRAGFDQLGAWLASHGVRRVGLEASGKYEQPVRRYLEGLGLEVVMHTPHEVRMFARLKRRRAKNDKIDARIIAEATTFIDRVRCASDPLLVELAERMTAYEQAADRLSQLKCQLEQITLEDLRIEQKAEIALAKARKDRLGEAVLTQLKSREDLVRNLELVTSICGFGEIVAASLLIRMPELGKLAHGQAASLLGAAPFDFESGAFRGQRHIWGGRARPRRMVYLAALVAKRHDPAMKAFAQRLGDKGKKPKVIVVAIMRKLIEAANLVLARQTPWRTNPT
jgi:transposase